MKRSLITAQFLVLSMIASPLFAGDIDTLEARLRAAYISGSSSGAENHLKSQQTNGSWSDINYSDRSRATWDPVNHLSRLKNMAVAYNTTGHAYYKNTTMLNAISKGLTFWYGAGCTSDNWWHTKIGQQLSLGPILMMMEDYLSSTQVNTGCTYLNDPGMTGLNLVDLATQTIQRGCLKESLTDINLGMNALKGEVFITTGEGIQPDYSYHQHGPLLYNFGYGSGYASGISLWIHYTRGLSFGFSADKIKIFTDFNLDGMQWMARRGHMDMACRGRNITRPNNGGSGFLTTVSSRMLEFSSERKDEIQGLIDHIKGTKDDALVGNKHFWRSDYQVNRRKNYHTSVNMCSKRTYGTEMINNENLKGYYVAFGNTPIMLKGDEYHNIYPVWDWARIPGVTSPHKNPPPAFTSQKIQGTTDFVGGASNGTYGAVGFDLNWDGVTGRKSWFYFDDEFVALGAGIKSSGSTPVYTSVNQTWLRGDVRVSYDASAGSVVPKGQSTLKSPRWVFHNGVGYLFPKAGNVELKNQAQSGSWNSINKAYSADVITKDVFSLWLDHGAAPSNAAYEYVVLPGTDTATMQKYAGDVSVRTISNTTALQAVRNDRLGVTGAVFYAAGQVAIRSGLSLKVNQPCIALVHEYADKILVTISNPKAQALSVVADLLWTNGTNESKTFSLPGGSNAGKSVTQSFTNADPEKLYTKIKADNTDHLHLGTSWVGGVRPTSTDTAVWDKTVTGSNFVYIGGTHSWAGIRIADPGGAVTIKGTVQSGPTLTLGAGGINMSAATQSFNLNSPVTLAASQEWSVAGGRTLTLQSESATSEAYAINKSGAGTLVIETDNFLHSGGTTVSAGTLQIGNNGTTGVLPGNVTNNGALKFYRSDNYAYSGVISGTGTVQQAGGAVLTLSGNNSYSGATTISDGSIYVSHANALGTAGSGTTIAGAGALKLTSSINLAEPLTINGGKLEGSGSNNIQSGTVAITGTVKMNTISGKLTVSGVISGSGAISKTTGNALVLSGANTYTGATTVSAGELVLTGSTHSSSSVTINSGATISGTGTIGGSLTIADSAIVEPGVSGAGRLSVGKGLTLNGTSVLNMDLGTVSDTIAITGNLTLDGTLNITADSGFAEGTYTIMTYTGTLTDSALEVGNAPDGYICSITSDSGRILLTVENDKAVAIIPVDALPNTFSSELLFYPNPVSLNDGKILFSIPKDLTGKFTVTIFDNLGNIIDSQDFNSNDGYTYSWDLRNRNGQQVGVGSYLAVISVITERGSQEVFKRIIGVTDR